MGIHMDSLEDAFERIDQASFRTYQTTVNKKPKSSPVHDCPLCSKRFGTRRSLDSHLRQHHSGQHVYFRVNGVVVRGNGSFSTPLEEFACVNLGDDSIVVVLTCATVQKKVEVKPKRSLTDLLPFGFEGELQVTIFRNTVELTSHFLRFNQRPVFDAGRLDPHIFRLQLSLDHGTIPEWTVYEAARDGECSTVMQKTYMDGFYEYSLAFHLLQSGQSASGHFEKALTMLRGFNTPLARTAQYVLAIRMNSFTTLNDCVRPSSFYPAREFFLNGILDLDVTRTLRSESDHGIYIDGFTERVLQLIRLFYLREIEDVDEVAALIRKQCTFADSNDEHKIQILQARCHRVKGDTRSAASHYAHLTNHPFFGEEAREYQQ